MKKITSKIIILFVLCLALFGVTWCKDNNKNEVKDNSNKNVEQVETSALKIGNFSVDLNKSATFQSIKYKYPEKALVSNVGNYAVIDLMDGENLVVRIGMCLFEHKTIREAIEGANLSSVDAIEYNNSTWNVYEGDDNGKNLMTYATQVGDDTYTITFLSPEEIKDFSNAFMNKVELNK